MRESVAAVSADAAVHVTRMATIGLDEQAAVEMEAECEAVAAMGAGADAAVAGAGSSSS